MPRLRNALLATALLALMPTSLTLAANGQSASQSHPLPEATKPQARCPVMGGPIDKALYVDAKGKRVYLCCAGCEGAVQAEPEKYIKKIEQRGESVADTPPAE